MKFSLSGNAEIYFSEKRDGDMLFKPELPEVNEKVRKNREAFFKKHGIPAERLVNLSGVHGNKVHIVKKTDLSKGALHEKTRISGVDGLVTNIPNSYLLVTGADCFPILFYEKTEGVIGALHTGWRGLVRGIITRALETLEKDFGGNPQNTDWWIGPGIGPCHFEVQKDVAEIFESKCPAAVIYDDPYRINLPEIIKMEIRSRGVPENKISFHPDCTYCEKEKWFSSRRDRRPYTKANAFIVGFVSQFSKIV